MVSMKAQKGRDYLPVVLAALSHLVRLSSGWGGGFDDVTEGGKSVEYSPFV